MLVMDEDLCEVLGFTKRQAIFGETLPVYFTGTFSSDIDRGMTSLFVYSDAVERRRVGDVMAPLLRTVPLAKETDRYTTVSHQFAVVQYVPASMSDSENINVRVCRDNGDTVVFSGGKVIVDLHFRRLR